MHTLPCASGGEDGVCLALTQLSKELMEDNTSAMQAGGCDSSDCLFCQYRSNSPFHLQAYAGKLTTLLRKRSLNGMALASRVDATTTTEASAGQLTATTAGTCGAAKRHRTTSSHGVLAPAASTRSSTAWPFNAADLAEPHLHTTTGAATTAANGQGTASPQAGGTDSFLQAGRRPTCLSSCCGRPCAEHLQGHALDPSPEPCTAAAPSQPWEPVAPGAHIRPSPSNAEPLGPGLEGGGAGGASSEVRTSGAEAVWAQWPPLDGPPDASGPQLEPGPGPSSVQLAHLLREAHHAHRCHPHQRGHQTHHHHQTHYVFQHQKHPQQDTLPASREELPGIHQHQQHQQREPQQQVHRQAAQPQGQGQERLVAGRPLPEGWAFRPEWRDRTDPAPAALEELMQLPGPGPLGRQYGGGRRGYASAASGTGSRCGFAGIVCALEFSPDGRLLAAGGVDKQIRLYNLSSAFGDLVDEEEEEGDDEGADEEDEFLVGLGPQTHGSLAGACGGGGGCGRGRGAGRRWLGSDGGGDSGDDDEEDDGGEPGEVGSLLAAVQRMPSKISSMAWSPFLDGVLTVGDYDGVLLQLHIASGHQLADVEAHGGRKIWSVAHSALRPHLAASAADDRCARLWAGRALSECVATLQPNPRASVCSVDFSPACDHLIALACADRTAYLYDLRSLDRGPLMALRHHSRPASYCRFLGGSSLVTASTDASLALWNIADAVPKLTGIILPPAAAAADGSQQLAAPRLGHIPPFQVVQEYGELPAVPAAALACGGGAAPATAGAAAADDDLGAHPSKIFKGHRNEKNFVGLSVRSADGLLACGSECSRAFAYHTSWSDPLAVLELPWAAAAAEAAAADPWVGNASRGAGGPVGQRRFSGAVATSGGGGGFVSAVCWQPAEAAAALGLPPLLASATSLGTVSVSVLAARH